MKHGPKHKICRKAGFCLWEKAKCPSNKRPYPPGMNAKKRKKPTLYGELLWEKQKLRFTYNISEKQFKNMAKLAKSQKGKTGDQLLQMCELRLDNLIWKMGFAPTIYAARQSVVHRHFTLNGKIHNIPSTQLKVGDKIAVRERDHSQFLKDHLKVSAHQKNLPPYVEVDADAASGRVLRVPDVEEIHKNGLQDKVIEFYSR